MSPLPAGSQCLVTEIKSRNCTKYADKYGIYINADCDLNVFKENIIRNNSLIGAFLDDANGETCENNYFYENYFHNNTLHARDDVNAVNLWYDPSNLIGNYWDNYTGADLDDDFIGDIGEIIIYSCSEQSLVTGVIDQIDNIRVQMIQ